MDHVDLSVSDLEELEQLVWTPRRVEVQAKISTGSVVDFFMFLLLGVAYEKLVKKPGELAATDKILLSVSE